MSNETRQMKNVAIFGIGGGLLSWLASLLVTPTAEWVWYLPLISMTLGAGASLVFVFAIANTDRTDRNRMLSLALLAGFFWEPVWEGARALVVNQVEQEAIANTAQALENASRLATEAADTRDADERRSLMRELNAEIARAGAYSRSINTQSGLNRAEGALGQLAVSLGALPPQERQDASEQWTRSFRPRVDSERFSLLPPVPESDTPP